MTVEHGQKIVDEMFGGSRKRGALFLRARMVGWTVAIRIRDMDGFLQSVVAGIGWVLAFPIYG